MHRHDAGVTKPGDLLSLGQEVFRGGELVSSWNLQGDMSLELWIERLPNLTEAACAEQGFEEVATECF